MFIKPLEIKRKLMTIEVTGALKGAKRDSRGVANENTITNTEEELLLKKLSTISVSDNDIEIRNYTQTCENDDGILYLYI